MDGMEYTDPYCYGPVAGTNIPLDHLDYGYVNDCKNVKELGQILKILRSGKEGIYPELIACTEKRLAELDPTNKLLIKNKPATRMADLPPDELAALNKDLEQWTDQVSNDTSISSELPEENGSIPPVRKPVVINKNSQTNSAQSTDPQSTPKGTERIKSYDFDAWSKYDVEQELGKVDKKDSQTPHKPVSSPRISCELSEKEKAFSSTEKERMANKEREKGNEAFRANDLEDAFAYYSRSLNFNPTVAAYNNRALIEIKLKRFQAAVDDCSLALKKEPTNTKALFRRGTAYTQLNKLHQATTDFERVLHFEPNNKKAQQELNTLRKKLAETGGQKSEKKAGRRIQIEEVEEEEVEPVAKETPTTDNDQTASGNQGVGSETSNLPSIKKEGPPPLPIQVQALKDEGNKLFKTGQYSDALEKYTLGIALLQTGDKSQEPNISMLLNNRAACQLKIGNCQGCIADSTRSLSLVVLNVKALMRRAKAYEHLEKFKHAYNDYQLALSIDRSLVSAYEASSRIIRLLREHEGNNWRDKLPVCSEAARVKEELQVLAIVESESKQEVSSSSKEDTQESSMFTENMQDMPESISINKEDAQGIHESSLNKEYPQESFLNEEDAGESPVSKEDAQETLESSANTEDVPANEDTPSDNDRDQPLPDQSADSTGLPSLPESSSSDSVATDTSTYNASVEESPDEVTPEPPINVTSSVNETKVTQSTQSVPSTHTSAPPSSKVKDDLLSPEEKFERHKLKGNEHVKKGEFVDALSYYNMCVSVCPNKVVGYTNRAFCHLKLNSPRNAETDCNKALSYEPGNVKALYRRALARKAMSHYAESIKDLRLLLTIDPENPIAKRELVEVKQLWEKQLRELQAKSSPRETRADRRKGTNPKAKSSKKNKELPQRTPTEAELERFQKLLKELEVSKEKIEKLSKVGPPGTSWGNSEGTLEDLPYTGPPPRATQGKSPNVGKKAKHKTGGASGKSASTTGKAPSKPKTKKVPKKPPKVNKTPKAEQQPPAPEEQSPPEDPSLPTKDQSLPTNQSPPNDQSEEVPSSEVKGDSPPASKGKRIVIEEIHSSDDQSSDDTTPPPPIELKEEQPTEEPASPPQLRSPFEFVQRWNAIPRTAKSSEYARLLEAIPPLKLPDVITTKLDGMMLTNIIRAVDKQFVPKGKYQLSLDILTSLSKVPRFGMIAMFMGPQEKSDLSNVLSTLSSQSTTDIPSSTIHHIRQLYGL